MSWIHRAVTKPVAKDLTSVAYPHVPHMPSHSPACPHIPHIPSHTSHTLTYPHMPHADTTCLHRKYPLPSPTLFLPGQDVPTFWCLPAYAYVTAYLLVPTCLRLRHLRLRHPRLGIVLHC